MEVLDLFAPADHGEDLDPDDPVCVLVLHEDWYPADTLVFDEWVEDTRILIDAGGGRLAYFGVRHSIELGLKMAAFGTGSNFPKEHKLADLLRALEDRRPDHRLHDDTSVDAVQLRHFIKQIDLHDSDGSEGRYAHRRTGALTFRGACHISRDRLRMCLDLVEDLLSPDRFEPLVTSP